MVEGWHRLALQASWVAKGGARHGCGHTHQRQLATQLDGAQRRTRRIVDQVRDASRGEQQFEGLGSRQDVALYFRRIGHERAHACGDHQCRARVRIDKRERWRVAGRPDVIQHAEDLLAERRLSQRPETKGHVGRRLWQRLVCELPVQGALQREQVGLLPDGDPADGLEGAANLGGSAERRRCHRA